MLTGGTQTAGQTVGITPTVPVQTAACPSCGYCPTCGRSNQQPYQYLPYPYVYPYQQPWYLTIGSVQASHACS